MLPHVLEKILKAQASESLAQFRAQGAVPRPLPVASETSAPKLRLVSAR